MPGQGQTFQLWRFVAGDSARVPYRYASDTAVVDIPPPVPPNEPPFPSLFCGGHTTLESGKALIVSGEYTSGIGTEYAYTFDPLWPQAGVTSPWEQQARQAQPRWYPTAITIDNGDAIAFGGDMHEKMVVFGGRTATAISDSHFVMAVGGTSYWSEDAASGPTPAAREGAVMFWNPDTLAQMVMFGGDSNGTSAHGKLRDVRTHQLQADDSTWAWNPGAGISFQVQ